MSVNSKCPCPILDILDNGYVIPKGFCAVLGMPAGCSEQKASTVYQLSMPYQTKLVPVLVTLL